MSEDSRPQALVARSTGTRFVGRRAATPLLALVLVSCSGSSQSQASSQSPTGPSASQAVPCTLGKGIAGVVLDVTYSTRNYVVPGARTIIDRNLDDLLKQPQCGRQLYVQKLGRDSWGLRNNILAAWVPPVPPLGPKPVHANGESEKLYLDALATWQAQKRFVDAEKRAAVKAVASIKVRLKSKLDPRKLPAEKEGVSDIKGAFVKFSDFVSGDNGPHFLLVLSDLVEAGHQSPGVIDLHKTKVNLVMSCSGQYASAQCTSIKRYWRRTLAKAGARPIIITPWEGRDFVDDAFS